MLKRSHPSPSLSKKKTRAYIYMNNKKKNKYNNIISWKPHTNFFCKNIISSNVKTFLFFSYIKDCLTSHR